MIKVSIFVPIYNEEEVIKENVIKIYNKLTQLKYVFELFLIDDNSNDKTPQICKKLAMNHSRIKYLRFTNGPTRRENLAKSFKKANYDLIFFMDADLSTDLKHVHELVHSISNGQDIVIGSRHIKNAIVHRNLSRRVVSFLFNKFVRLYFKSNIYDHECGFKIFKKKVIFNLLNELKYDFKLKRKMLWDTELLLRAQKNNYLISEIPILWIAGKKSALRFFSETSMISYLLNLKKELGKVN